MQPGRTTGKLQRGLTKTTTHRERLKKQTGGSGLFADMEFELGPADEDFLQSDDFKSGKKKLQFEWGIVGGAIDKNYQKPINDGFTCNDEQRYPGRLQHRLDESARDRRWYARRGLQTDRFRTCVPKKVSALLLRLPNRKSWSPS
jgi:hypothetical protein